MFDKPTIIERHFLTPAHLLAAKFMCEEQSQVFRYPGAVFAGGIILHAGKHPKLAFHGNDAFMRITDHIPRQLHVLYIWKGRTVDHNARVSALYGGDTAIHALAVVQMNLDGQRVVSQAPGDGSDDVGDAFLLVGTG